MDRRAFCARALGLAAVSVASPLAGFAAEPKEIAWQTDLRAAQRLAAQENKPLLIVFGADWCTYCHKLERDTLSDPKVVSRINSDFVPVHLDLDREKKAAKILEVTSIPCTVVLSPDADLLGRAVGYTKPEPFQRLLQESLHMQQQIQQAKFSQQP